MYSEFIDPYEDEKRPEYEYISWVEVVEDTGGDGWGSWEGWGDGNGIGDGLRMIETFYDPEICLMHVGRNVHYVF